MADPDYFGLFMDEDPQAKAQALAEALQRRQAYASANRGLGMVAGLGQNDLLAGLAQRAMQTGAAAQDDAQQGRGLLAQAGQFRAGERLRRALSPNREPAEEELAYKKALTEQASAAAERMRRGPAPREPKTVNPLDDELKRARLAKLKADGGKEGSGAAASMLEGFELDPTFRPREADVSKLRDAQAATRTIEETIDRISSLYKQHGANALPSGARGEMEALTADLQLALKGPEAYALGVLAGPDMAILDAVTGKTFGTGATIADMVGGNNAMSRLTALRGQIGKRFSNKARAYGYRARTGAPVPSAGDVSLDETESPVAFTPEKSARLEELRKKRAAGELK